MDYDYYTLGVFTDQVFGGNPLAVFPAADGLGETAMRSIARELNLAETVFVFGGGDGVTRRIRILTPRVELPFAGHPTIGTAVLLLELGAVPLASGAGRIVLGEGIGPVPVEVWRDEAARPWARLTLERPVERGPAPPPPAEVAALLGLDQADLLGEAWPPAALSLGVPFLVVPVRDVGVLARARLDLARWTVLLSRAWAPQVYVVAPAGAASAAHYQARVFAPALGIAEDPATGAGAVVLAWYLAERNGGNGRCGWVIEQGIQMGRPSRLLIDAETGPGGVSAVRLSGSAVRVARGILHVPDELVVGAARGAGGPAAGVAGY